MPKLDRAAIGLASLEMMSEWARIHSSKLCCLVLYSLDLASIFKVEIGTPDGQEISQFLQFEQYSRENSVFSSTPLNRSRAGPIILGPAYLRVTAETGQYATQEVQAMQLSGSLWLFFIIFSSYASRPAR